MNADQKQLLQQLATLAIEQEQVIATAESCTGGLIAAALTELAGSSTWFDRGFVTYSNAAKRELLGVSEETLHGPGAVSAATVAEMAQGALSRSGASLTVSVSGVAGPGGGSAEKPVGTVWMAWASRDYGHRTRHFLFTGDRDSIRQQTVTEALRGLVDCILSEPLATPVRH
jgi:nicotinamide-nucleotide amidase